MLCTVVLLAAGAQAWAQDRDREQDRPREPERPQIRFEFGAQWTDFDTEMELDDDSGFTTSIAVNVFQRLWIYGEFRHTETEFDLITGPDPEEPVNVDTYIVGVYGYRPIDPYMHFVVHAGVGSQRYDPATPAADSDSGRLATVGASLLYLVEEFIYLRFGGAIEVVRTDFNEPDGNEETNHNFYLFLSLGFQF